MRTGLLATLAMIGAVLATSGAGAGAAHAAPALDVTLANDANEVQIISLRATAGQFRLRFGDGGPGVAETPDMPHNATGEQVQAALNALTNISSNGGSVTVSTRSGAFFRVVFDGGPLANADVPLLVPAAGTTPLTGPFPRPAQIWTSEPAGIHRNDLRMDYLVKVRNTANATPGVGDELFCNGTPIPPGTKTWTGTPDPSLYQFAWLRDGVAIPSATASTYTVTAADFGKALQCQVTGRNTTPAGFVSASQPALVPGPQPATAPPVADFPTGTSSRPAAPAVSGPAGTAVVEGQTLTCTAPVAGWPGVSSWTFAWWRNGVPATGATSQPTATTSTYVLTAADDDTRAQFQCEAIATNPGGSVATFSGDRATTAPMNYSGGTGAFPWVFNGPAQTPAIAFGNATSGAVTVEVTLPDGVQTVESFYAAPRSDQPVTVNGWSCAAQPASGAIPAKATCMRLNVLGPQQEYPRIGIGIALDAGAPDDLAASATVTGGGTSGSASDGDEISFLSAFPFGITPGSLVTGVFDTLGGEYTEAGGHPYAVDASLALNAHRRLNGGGSTSAVGGQQFYDRFGPVEPIKNLRTDTPPGFVGNPLAPPVQCEDPQLLIKLPPACPLESVVGEAYFTARGMGDAQPGQSWVYKALVAIEPERGMPAQFAFADTQTKGIYVLNARLRPEDGYAVSLDIAPATQQVQLTGLGATICGYGASAVILPAVLEFRGCNQPGDPGAWDVPLVTLPTACTGTLETRMSADSWEHPGAFISEVTEEPAITACDQVPFTPSVAMSPTSEMADSSSGFDASIDIPSDGLEDPEGISQSHLKKTVVELPAGVSVNPSAATGLQGCSDAELGLKSDSEPSCPEASKIGTVEATTPVLEETLSGVMVLRTPKSTDPQSGEMLRVALVVRNDERGILVKLPGSAVANPQTGRLTATFDDNPQLPIGHVEVHLRGGSRGVLATGRDCGRVSTKATLTPWSGNADAVSDTPSEIDQRCSDGFAPKLSAGSSDNRARGQGGAYSFKFSREDGEQWLRGLTAKLPKGLLASVRDVPLCSNHAADAGNCPVSSKIGIVDAKAGAGDPFVLEEKGEVFLTEGYKGGEYGLAVKIRPVAGPFRGEYELSPIVVRQAIHVDRTTAEVTAVSDPFPLIHHGIPLRAREVNVLVNRTGFMLNPSDCERKQSSATLLSDEGATAGFSDPFQVSGCANLAFKPKLALKLTGKKQTRTGKHPGIKATVTQAGVSEAGIEKAVVRLPKSLALDPENAQALCEFVDGTKPDLENHCPKGSIVGRARAKTPLLKDDLVGNVYFVKNVKRSSTGNLIRTLPMIIVALRGEIAINLKGESNTTESGKLVNTFASVPDAPISQFNLNINGGKTGIIAVTRTRKAMINLCAGRHTAEADMDGHNGRRYDRDIRMKTPCTKRQVKKAKRAAAKARAGSERG